MKTDENRAVACTSFVLPLDAPNETGWWWGRSKDNPLPDDEFCVEVSMGEGGTMIFWGRDYGYLKDWEQFHGCEWIKATMPWQNAALCGEPKPSQCQ